MSAKGNLRPNLGSRAERQGRCTDASRRCNSLTAHAVAVLEPAHPLSQFLNDSPFSRALSSVRIRFSMLHTSPAVGLCIVLARRDFHSFLLWIGTTI